MSNQNKLSTTEAASVRKTLNEILKYEYQSKFKDVRKSYNSVIDYLKKKDAQDEPTFTPLFIYKEHIDTIHDNTSRYKLRQEINIVLDYIIRDYSV